MVDRVGGPARARVIFLFGAVLALNTADASTVGAVAAQLEPALHIGNAKIGLLGSAPLFTGALAVLPVGALVDRVRRVRLLATSIVFWSLAMLLSGAADSYETLIYSRLALGVVTATAGPAIASLTGDYFGARERGRIYGYILGGEIAGTALGFIVSGSIAAALSWRFAFWAIAIPGFFLARSIWQTLPEPRRGGQSRLQRGELDLFAAAAGPDTVPTQPDKSEEPTRELNLAHEVMRQRGIRANRNRILREDATRMTLAQAVRYVLRVPTNVILIISSALGYFFLAGLNTFVLVFVRSHYHTGQAEATGVLGVLVIGALAGTLISGRLTDWMLRQGVINARVLVPAVSYVAAAILLVVGVLESSLTPALWFDTAGAALIAAANPPLDAGRLDIMPAGLWGRAESVRTVLRTLGQALAPLMFGAVADLVAGFTPHQAPIGTKPGGIEPGTATGLEVSFLLMLIPLAAAGLFLIRARHTYPTDVATAAEAVS